MFRHKYIKNDEPGYIKAKNREGAKGFSKSSQPSPKPNFGLAGTQVGY